MRSHPSRIIRTNMALRVLLGMRKQPRLHKFQQRTEQRRRRVTGCEEEGEIMKPCCISPSVCLSTAKQNWHNLFCCPFISLIYPKTIRLRPLEVFPFVAGLVLGLAYFLFISKHFQTLTNFSMLTNLEKELSLPTDTVSPASAQLVAA